MKTFLLLLLLLNMAQQSYAQNKDLTSNYQTLKVDNNLNAENLKGIKVFFVSGFFAKYVDLFNGYYSEQMDVLKSYGLKEGTDYQKIITDTEQSVSNNAQVIWGNVMLSDKPVLIVSHSKGSAETLEALINNPEMQERVVGWINIQGALKGSFIADALTCKITNTCPDKEWMPPPEKTWAQGLLRSFFGSYIQITAGTEQGLLDLQRNHRLKFLEDNQEKIIELQKKLPVISVVTHMPNKDLPFNYRMGQKYLSTPTKDNDGLIYSESQMLPESYYINLKNHHNGLVAPGNGPKQALFFEKILNLFWGL